MGTGDNELRNISQEEKSKSLGNSKDFPRVLLYQFVTFKIELFIVMFNVYNVLVREDEEKEKYNIENLIQFDKKVVKNGVRVEAVEPFNFWFGEQNQFAVLYINNIVFFKITC